MGCPGLPHEEMSRETNLAQHDGTAAGDPAWANSRQKAAGAIVLIAFVTAS
jgi:hypothetical protein